MCLWEFKSWCKPVIVGKKVCDNLCERWRGTFLCYCVPVGVGYKVCVSGRLTVGVGQLEMDRRCMTVGE